jgi:hypothetical protein
MKQVSQKQFIIALGIQKELLIIKRKSGKDQRETVYSETREYIKDGKTEQLYVNCYNRKLSE